MDYQKIYDNLIRKRLENPPTEKFERHHIVPRSLGGSDDKDNIVKLTLREHYIAHLLLCKNSSRNAKLLFDVEGVQHDEGGSRRYSY